MKTPNMRKARTSGAATKSESSRTPNATSALSLTSLNDNCLVLMLSNLPFQDLNSFAMCNRQCCELRRHESLDQTRSGTIVCGEDSTIRSLFDAPSSTMNGTMRLLETGPILGLRVLRGFCVTRTLPIISVTLLTACKHRCWESKAWTYLKIP